MEVKLVHEKRFKGLWKMKELIDERYNVCREASNVELLFSC